MAKPHPHRDPRLGGIFDDIGDALEQGGSYINQHRDEIAEVAEVVVPLIAPYAAPVVAAEHLLRTGQPLARGEAKAATEGATAVGKAVAAHVAATQVAGSSEETSVTTRASQDLPDPDARKSSNTGLVIVGAVVFGLILLGMD